MRRIVTYFFRSLSVTASVGFLVAEKAAPQRILIDLEYDCPDTLDTPDEVASVLNYDSVREEVATIAGKRHFNLQETLCRDILTSLLARPQVIRARVSVQKPDIYADVDTVGVTMEARKR